MEFTVWIWIVLCAFFWGAYPVLEKFATIHPAWASALLTIGSVPIASIGLLYKPAAPDLKATMITLICGAMLGAGMFGFGKLLGWPGLDIGKMYPIIIGLVGVISAVCGIIFLGSPISVTKIAGLAAVCIGVYLLS